MATEYLKRMVRYLSDLLVIGYAFHISIVLTVLTHTTERTVRLRHGAVFIGSDCSIS